MPHPQPGARSGSEPARRVTEATRHGRIPLRVHPEWARAFPWVVQGTTVRAGGEARDRGRDRAARTGAGERATAGADGGTGADADFGLFTGAPAGEVMKRWECLAKDTGCGSLVHARQVHGCAVTLHEATPQGLILAPPCDGHATHQPGTLLAVSVADCVPVFVVAPRVRAVMLLHAGWRGVAGGILEAGLAMLERDFGTHAREAHMHMGPAICGRCYEVGREVHEALGLPRPASPSQPVDLRRVLAGRALAAGADPAHLTTSTFCTRCADAPFFSHRGGDAGCQVAVLGITPDDSAPPGRGMARRTSPEAAPAACGRPLVDRSLQDLRADPSVGLCSVCAHSRVTGNRRGSIFWLCRLSAEDARFRRYPRLPVARCAGFEPAGAGQAGEGRKYQKRKAEQSANQQRNRIGRTEE